MTTSEHILVIILSSALALFLLLAIVVAILAIQLVQTLRRIAGRAEHIVQTAESMGDVIRNTAGSWGVVRFIRTMSDIVAQHKANKEK